jgi:hypothetical protein
MNNFLKTFEISQQMANKIDPSSFVLALLASLVSALIASALYSYFYENRGTGSQVHRAFPLLALSITTLFIGVQMSLPLSLGLLGALSIVRFRTPVKEPEEIGFVMLVIASSITCATFNFHLLVILYFIAILTLFLIRGRRLWKYKGRDGLMILSMNNDHAPVGLPMICQYLDGQTTHNKLESSSSRDGVTLVQFSFTGLKKQVSEIQSEIKKLSDVHSMQIFFSRPGGIR